MFVFDRYIELIYSLWHRAYFTKKAIYISISLIWIFAFLAELLSALWLEIFPGWNLVADDVQTTCGRRADDTRVRLRWRFQLADDICHPDVVRTSSAHAHIVRTSSAHHPHHSSWSAWAWTIFYCDRNLLFDGICGENVELFHFGIM